MANLTNSSNIIDEINSKLTNPDGWSNGQVLTMVWWERDTQWPCPDWYHVPTTDEWKAVFNAWVALGQWSGSNGDSFRIKMKMPFAGYLSYYNATVTYQGSNAYLWSSSPNLSSNTQANYFGLVYGYVYTNRSDLRAEGFPVRPFKNIPAIPTSNWTTIYAWSNGSWIYHDATEWVISISSDWQTWITIADKNLWATTVYNDWDTLSEANCWYYYQWWNNYGFAWSWDVVTSDTQVDSSSYWPWNYYSSSIFIKWRYDRSSVINDNLRWWVTNLRPEKKAEWKDIEALPEWWTAGQVLTKTDDGAEWSDKKLIFEIESNIINFNRIDHNLSETLEFADEDMAIIQKAYEEYKKWNNVKLRIKDTSQQEGPFNEVRYHDLDIVSIEEQDEIPWMDRKRVDIKWMYWPHYYFLMNCVLVDWALRWNVIYFKSLDSDIIPEKYYENNKYAATYNNTMYVITSDATYSDIKYIAKWPIKVSVWSWDVRYSDFNFVQLSWSSVELSISSAIEPTSNFTINAPSTLKDWLIYTLRVKNWATAYTMTLGEWITNPWDTDITLTPNAIDQFVFLAVDWVLELQPEAGGGGWDWKLTVYVTQEQYEQLTPEEWVDYVIYNVSTPTGKWFIEAKNEWTSWQVLTMTDEGAEWQDAQSWWTEVVTEVPAEEVAGKLYLIKDN